MEPILEINHVNYSYHSMLGETPALSNINMTVQQGDFIAIVGPSGCGNAMVLLWKQRLHYRIRQPLMVIFLFNDCRR